ncbi:MAG: PQQ-dependent sugar dehydrogenase [Burkholderiaceae bacterium]
MHKPRFSPLLAPVALVLAASLASCAQMGGSRGDAAPVGDTTFTAWPTDAPGVRRHIEVHDLPDATMTGTDPEASVAQRVTVVDRPQGALPTVPRGFDVQVFATGFEQPRVLRVAPNGDIFLSDSGAGRVLVFRAGANGPAARAEVFADGLDRPFGIAFVPPRDPQYVYVAAADQVVRYPYRQGAMKAGGPAEVIIDDIPTTRHWTRDLAVSRDGRRLFLAVGSASNLGASMPDMTAEAIQRHEASHGRGAAWGDEQNRGVVRVFDPEGSSISNYATGLRNCSGLVMQPGTDRLWCVMNERDHLGPHLVPDFFTQVEDGAFYGWPWYYLGNNEDPAWKGARPDLVGDVTIPDVLIQAHSSALNAAFYDGDAFPAAYRGDAFLALHGSHSRPERTGYKVVRVLMDDGKPTGEYEDFMTGFLVDNDHAWGRPAGVAVTRDGALLVSDDANGTIYRVTHR